MNQRLASTLGFSGTVLAATLAAACMSGIAHAEYPSVDILNFVGTRTTAEVRGEVMNDRVLVSTASNESTMQGSQSQPMRTGLTRAEVRDEYLDARDEVRAMTAEDSGSSWLAHAHAQVPATSVVASHAAR
ncbi:MAG: hypothetical protein ACJ8GO_15680 [Ramlibacter sp.]